MLAKAFAVEFNQNGGLGRIGRMAAAAIDDDICFRPFHRTGEERVALRKGAARARIADCKRHLCHAPNIALPSYTKKPRPDFRPSRPAATMRRKSGGAAARGSSVTG